MKEWGLIKQLASGRIVVELYETEHDANVAQSYYRIKGINAWVAHVPGVKEATK